MSPRRVVYELLNINFKILNIFIEKKVKYI